MAISVADRKKLHDRAGGECSFPDCGERQGLQEAHIVAKEDGGPRADLSMPKAERDKYDNRIMLCPTHHVVIDKQEQEWPVEKLLAMKSAHEQDVAQRPPVGATGSKVGDDFWLEPGAPRFHVSPGVHEATGEEVKLMMTFSQIAGDDVTPVIEWSGANAEPSQPLMMDEPQRPGAKYQKFQLKASLAHPSTPADEVTFDIRFRWQGATRQYRWCWPLYIREKGIWGMNNVAENTMEPAERTTLD